MGKIIIGIAALLLLLGGGAGAYFFFLQPADASLIEGDEHAGKEEKGKKGDHAEKGGESRFVEFSPLILPIVDGNGVNQVISLVLSLEVTGQDNVDEVTAMMPRLQNAFIQDMYGVLNRHAMFKGGPVEVDYIKKRLGRISDKIMGEDKVDSVLLQVVQQRPI